MSSSPVVPVPFPAPTSRAHGAARRVLGCDHLAADVVQEALLALWQLASPPVDAAAWLTRAAVLRARQLRRSLLRRGHHEHCAAACGEQLRCDNPLHHAHLHEIAARLDGALAALPPAQRRVFELQAAGGLSYGEIAARVGVPVGTVRSRLARARWGLAARLPDGAADVE